jgi:hypothetical protein
MLVLSLFYSVLHSGVTSTFYIIPMLYCCVSVFIVHKEKYNTIAVAITSIWNVTLCSLLEFQCCLDKYTASIFRFKEKSKQRATWTSQSETWFKYRPLKVSERTNMGKLLYSHVFIVLLAGCMLVTLFCPEGGGVWFAETLASIHQTTCYYVAEDRTLCNHSCENFGTDALR